MTRVFECYRLTTTPIPEKDLTELRAKNKPRNEGRRCAAIPNKARSRPHSEDNVAGERVARGCYLNRARGRSGRYGGGDKRRRDYGERGRNAVKGNAGCARKVVAEGSGRGSRLHKRLKPHSQAEDRAFAVGPTFAGCPVEFPVSGLNQTGIRESTVSGVEVVQSRNRSGIDGVEIVDGACTVV